MKHIVSDPNDFRGVCAEARAAGHRVGIVPTMGALHEGHFSLIRHAADCGATFRAVTVFLNPAQFAPHEDLDAYPRTLNDDIRACGELGVDMVFAPREADIYPEGFATRVAVPSLGEVLEGVHRPHFFPGVCTIVAKLFSLAGPSLAVFGRKDYQQFRIVERMILDLCLPIDIVGHPIVRETDDLAQSSRNRYLNHEERTRARSMIQGLRQAAKAWKNGCRSPLELESIAREPIEDNFDSVDYVTAVCPTTLRRAAPPITEAVLLAAGHVGATRLIDNIELPPAGKT